MLRNSEFITTRMEILDKHNDQIEQGIRLATTDARYNDPVVKLLEVYQKTEKSVTEARLNIFKTLTLCNSPDGNVEFKPYDLPAFKAYAMIIDDGTQKLLSIEDALSKLERLQGIGFYADLQRAANASKSKLQHLNAKLEQLGHSTRFEDSGIKQQAKSTREEISNTSSELEKHQAILDKIDAILLEVDACK
ncbi:MAG: hypothetical protein ABR985_02530 [Methanotrichaceae archaeon]|jgi:hypothetical protein